MDFFQTIFEWFKSLFKDFNGWMASVFRFDYHMLNFYDKVVAPLPEWVKIIGLLVVLTSLILGLIQLIKKSFKLVIILLVIFAIIILITWL